MESSRLILSRIGAAYSVSRTAFAALLAVAALLVVGGPSAVAQDLSAPLPLDLAIRTVDGAAADLADLVEAALVEQVVDALAHRQPSRLVLARDAVRASHLVRQLLAAL